MKPLVTLQQMSDDQLKNRLPEIETGLRRLRGMNKAGMDPQGQFFGQTNTLLKLRKEKARILTLLRERELKREAEKK